MSYANWLPRQFPPPLQGAVGTALWSQFGAGLDFGKDRAMAATKSRFPSVAPSLDNVIRVKIVTGGPLGSMTFAWGLDGGAYSSAVTSLGVATFAFDIPGTTSMLFFSAVAYAANDIYTFDPDGTIARTGSGPADAVTVSPGGALLRIGNDRQIIPGPAESAASYRLRLDQAWDTWTRAGTHLGLLLELKAQGFPTGANGATIVQHNGRYAQLSATDDLVLGSTMLCDTRMDLARELQSPRLNGFTLDIRDQFYSSFMIIFPINVPTLRAGTNSAGRLNATVQKWKPGKAIYIGATVITTGGVWGWPLTKTWGDGGKWGEGITAFVPPVESDFDATGEMVGSAFFAITSAGSLSGAGRGAASFTVSASATAKGAGKLVGNATVGVTGSARPNGAMTGVATLAVTGSGTLT